MQMPSFRMVAIDFLRAALQAIFATLALACPKRLLHRQTRAVSRQEISKRAAPAAPRDLESHRIDMPAQVGAGWAGELRPDLRVRQVRVRVSFDPSFPAREQRSRSTSLRGWFDFDVSYRLHVLGRSHIAILISTVPLAVMYSSVSAHGAACAVAVWNLSGTRAIRCNRGEALRRRRYDAPKVLNRSVIERWRHGWPRVLAPSGEALRQGGHLDSQGLEGMDLLRVLFRSSATYHTVTRQFYRKMSAPASSSLPHTDLNHFLRQQRGAFRAAPQDGSTGVRLVMGNEAGDLDSLACAIAFSYLAHQRSPQEPTWFPLVQTNRQDFKLRPENQLALKACLIDEDNIISLDDWTQRQTETKDKAEIALVDHCKLAARWKDNVEVTAVIDQ